MRRSPLALLVLACAISSTLLSGCGLAPAEHTPTIWRCIADGARTAGPCSESDYREQQREQPLLKEATRVFEAYTSESIRLAHAGGSDGATPVLQETLTGAWFRSEVRYQADLKRFGQKTIGEETHAPPFIDRNQTRPGSVFTVRVCEDWREYRHLDREGRVVGVGQLMLGTFFYKYDEGLLKIFDYSGNAVDKCPS